MITINPSQLFRMEDKIPYGLSVHWLVVEGKKKAGHIVPCRHASSPFDESLKGNAVIIFPHAPKVHGLLKTGTDLKTGGKGLGPPPPDLRASLLDPHEPDRAVRVSIAQPVV